MNVGMLWFDNDPKTTLEAKVAKAADYYKTKYGHVANLCLVHPDTLKESNQEEIQVGSVIVSPNKSILRGHIWIGTEDKG